MKTQPITVSVKRQTRSKTSPITHIYIQQKPERLGDEVDTIELTIEQAQSLMAYLKGALDKL
jgi:hypothetical protein